MREGNDQRNQDLRKAEKPFIDYNKGRKKVKRVGWRLVKEEVLLVAEKFSVKWKARLSAESEK
jgi:hypothetical protein